MTLEEWRNEHIRTCEKRKTQRSAPMLLEDGTIVRFAPGFDETAWSTVGVPYTDCSSVCHACGAWWKGRIYDSPSAEA